MYGPRDIEASGVWSISEGSNRNRVSDNDDESDVDVDVEAQGQWGFWDFWELHLTVSNLQGGARIGRTKPGAF